MLPKIMKYTKHNVLIAFAGLILSLILTIACAQATEETYLERGIRYYYNGDYDSAVKQYNEAIMLDPNNSTAYAYRGEAYRMKSQYDQAVSDLN